MSVAEIDSEAKQNVVETDAQYGPWTHCVVIMEQPPLWGDALPPEWRVSATLTLVDPLFGKDPVLADLPTVVVGPLIHKRQVVAMARYPGRVAKWSFRFESDAGRATARVWLHPGNAPVVDCGIFVVRHGLSGRS
ncbi:hypothetical protein [Polyangium sp. 15x6]|uniref:hypothetical protein n=1 Tax=Polyangium sp. 15x6 TaxID=3042687 RepID=UPI00249C0E1A|nr:hypothetical protein [Polyangium sp. 15x6]MDI3291910.1 hypothetical protein [Polyangium sp. 15x6]